MKTIIDRSMKRGELKPLLLGMAEGDVLVFPIRKMATVRSTIATALASERSEGAAWATNTDYGNGTIEVTRCRPEDASDNATALKADDTDLQYWKKRCMTMLAHLQGETFSMGKAAQKVGGKSRLRKLIENGDIEVFRNSTSPNAKWQCNAAQVMMHCKMMMQ